MLMSIYSGYVLKADAAAAMLKLIRPSCGHFPDGNLMGKNCMRP